MIIERVFRAECRELCFQGQVSLYHKNSHSATPASTGLHNTAGMFVYALSNTEGIQSGKEIH